MKRSTLCLLLLLPLLTGAACSQDKPADQAAALTVGVMPSMDYLPLAVALREGYLREAGLELSLMRFYSANERDAALQSGQVDGAVTDYTGAALQKNGGLELRLTSRCDAPFYLMAGPKSGIENPAGLKGARIAVASNTVIDYFVDMALQTAGLEASAAQKVEINRIPLRFEMLMSGGVEATGLPDPLALLAESGGGRTLTSNLELGLSITGMVFTEQAMRAKAGLIKKMYLAYNCGVEYLAAHSPEDVRDILTQQMGFSPEQVHASTRLPLYRKAAPPPEEDLRAVLDWLAARGLIRSGLEPDALVNKAFLPE